MTMNRLNIVDKSIQTLGEKKCHGLKESVDLDIALPRQPLLRRLCKHPFLMHYHRLFLLVIATNITVFLQGVSESTLHWSNPDVLPMLSNLVVVNVFIAILVRQQYVINALFFLTTAVPNSWPLSIRALMAKVYHFGGLHSGCAVASVFWFLLFTSIQYYQAANHIIVIPVELLVVSLVLSVALVLMVFMALPAIRRRFHNQFEITHRFAGWVVLVLFWAQTLMLTNLHRGSVSYGGALLSTTHFWMLAVATISILLPWLRLKKVNIDIEKPSSHVALTQFDYGVTPFAGSSMVISRNPLFEWHAFANVVTPECEGFSLTISRAGDWTGQFIDELLASVWVKGIPTAGVGNIELLFKRIIWVATGSGIGPCLPHLLSGKTPCNLVWATKNPRKTYGNALVDDVLKVLPDAIIWDTDAKGKPDLVKLAYQEKKAFSAEAIICIANKKVTWQVVYGMESRGTPAYGAIWDS